MINTVSKKMLFKEGDLLTQQHLQQAFNQLRQERRFSSEINQIKNQVGILKLEIDEEALETHRLQIKQLVAVLETGEWLYYQQELNAPQQDWYVDLDSYLVRSQETKTLLLQVRVAKADTYHGVEGYPSTASKEAKWLAYSERCPDEMDHSRVASLAVAKLNMQLIVHEESSQGETAIEPYHTLPLLRLKWQGIQWFNDSHFIPPVIEIGASPAITQCLRRFLTALKPLEKAYLQLLETAELANPEIRYTVKYRLQALAQLHYTCEKMIQQKHRRFSDLWDALSQHGFTWAYDRTQRHPQDLPDWHKHQSNWFPALNALCQRLELEVTQGLPIQVESIPLTFNPIDKVYETGYLSPSCLSSKQFYLELISREPEKTLIEKGLKAKISEKTRLSHLIIRALKGLSLHVVPEKNHYLDGEYHCYFKLIQAGDDWDQIQKTGQIAIFLENPFQVEQLKLLAYPASAL